jgi:hypothetical protein
LASSKAANPCCRAHESAALVPEQLAFEETEWNGGAIYLHERVMAAFAAVVNDFREPPFPVSVSPKMSTVESVVPAISV